MARCKKCNAEIKFLKNSRGKWHPCNPTLIQSKDAAIGTVLINKETARVITVTEDMPHQFAGYESHFGSCPHAKEFRKERKKEKKEEVNNTPNWNGKCEVCGASPTHPETGMCGPCTFGEADTINGNW